MELKLNNLWFPTTAISSEIKLPLSQPFANPRPAMARKACALCPVL